MSFSSYIKNLEKRGIISRKPHPTIPFILAFIALVLGVVVFYGNINKIWSYAFFFIAGFTFIFSILHLIVVRILEGRERSDR